MTLKLFVGNLSWSTTDASLREAFESYGVVTEAKIIFDRETGKSRGFGFVTFESLEDGAEALESLNGVQLDGMAIRVSEAQERKREGRRGPVRQERRPRKENYPEPEVITRRVSRNRQ